MNQVEGMPCFLSSARTRAAPLTPNSPRDTGVGVVMPRAIQPEIASKSKLMQTICFTTRRMGRGFSVMSLEIDVIYSIQLQARLLHDRGVSVVLPPEEPGVFLGRVARRLLAQGEEAFPDFGNLEDLADLPRRLPGNFPRRSPGRHEADPAGHLVAGEVIGDGRQLGHGRRALCARHAKRPQATRFHEADDAGHS